MALNTHTKPHLPITEAEFDTLMIRIASVVDADAVKDLSDDELLIFAEADELICADPQAKALRDSLPAWPIVAQLIAEEIASR